MEESLLATMREIAKGEGAYSRDPLAHAGNAIESMKAMANRAIADADALGLGDRAAQHAACVEFVRWDEEDGNPCEHDGQLRSPFARIRFKLIEATKKVINAEK